VGASEVTTLWRYTNMFIIIIFLTPVLNSQGMKKNTLSKEKINAGMVKIPPPPSQNCHAEIIIIII